VRRIDVGAQNCGEQRLAVDLAGSDAGELHARRLIHGGPPYL
jgi:hypothetical protein